MAACPATNQGPFPLCFGQVRTLKLEKRQDAHHVQELERSLAHLRNQLAEAPHPKPPVRPSVAEQQLKFETNLLRKNLESLTEQLQAQVKNSENLNRLSSEQKKRLWQQEESLQVQKERMRLQERSWCADPPGSLSFRALQEFVSPPVKWGNVALM
nr:putative golgin subfamily A member 6-like protein 3 [Aotus nancymaae]